MPTHLVRACVLLAVAAGSAFAADKPKGKKEKPTPPPTVGAGLGTVIGEATGNPKTGAVVGPLLGPDAAASLDGKFVVTKPVGTWFKDVRLENLACRIVLTIQEDRLAIVCEMTDNKNRFTMRLDADYAINKEGCLFGVIDTFETNLPQVEELGDSTKLSGQPYSFRFRSDEGSLSLKEFKGLGVGWSSEATPENMKRVISFLSGRYTVVDPAKPLPELKRSAEDVKRSEENEQRERERLLRMMELRVGEFNTPKPDSEPRKMDEPARQGELLHQEFDSWQPGTTPAKPRPMTPPDATHPERIHGGILKADPPKVTEEDFRVVGEAFRQIWNCVCPVKFGYTTRLGGVPYPTPHYLKHYPQYFAPDPAFPHQKERDSMLDPTGEIRRGNPPPCENDRIVRQDQLLQKSKDLRIIGETWRRFWFAGMPGNMTPDRIKDGIMDAPSEMEYTCDTGCISPILSPLKKGEQPNCDPPSDAEVLRVFAERPGMKGVAAEEVMVVKKLAKEKLDDPRFYPLVGMAQRHRCQWECSVYYHDGKRVKVETICIDKDRLHLYVGEKPDTQRDVLLEITKWR